MTVVVSKHSSKKPVKEKQQPAISNKDQNEFNQQVNKNKKKVNGLHTEHSPNHYNYFVLFDS